MAKTTCPRCGKWMDLDDYHKHNMCFDRWEKARQEKNNMPELTPGLIVEFRDGANEHVIFNCKVDGSYLANDGLRIILKIIRHQEFVFDERTQTVFSNIIVLVESLKWDNERRVIYCQ